MGFKSPQDRPGTSRSRSGNDKAGSTGRDDGTGPLRGPKTGRLTDYNNHGTSTADRGSNPRSNPEGLHTRGVVKGAATPGKLKSGEIQDVTVAPDGTRRVQGDKG